MNSLQEGLERPRVLLVGGSDVDSRLDMMNVLRGEFDLAAAGSAPELADKFSEAGFRFFRYPLDRGRTPLADVRTVLALGRIIAEYDPHIVHTFDTKPCVWGRIAARWKRVPIIVGTIPGLGALYTSNDFRTRAVRRLYQRLQRVACSFSDLTIFQNQHDLKEFLSAAVVSDDKAIVIGGSGVHTDFFDREVVNEAATQELRQRWGAGPETIIVTMICRLVRTKGVLDFANAAARVLQEQRDVLFLLVGPKDHEGLDGLTEQELAEAQRFVTWTGPQPDIRLILAMSDVCALPSYYREGVPRVLLEAAAMGLPLVTTTTPGCEDVVEDGVNGTLVVPRDPAALAKAIADLAANPAKRARFGAASRQMAEERFDLAIIAEEIAIQYRALLAVGTPSVPKRRSGGGAASPTVTPTATAVSRRS